MIRQLAIVATGLAIAGCVSLPHDMPEARLVLVKPMSCCLFNCRVIIEQQTAQGAQSVSQSGGAVTETDSHDRGKPR